MITNIADIIPVVYVVLGVDENGHDQVLGVFSIQESAQRFCTQFMAEDIYYDLWIEKHSIIS